MFGVPEYLHSDNAKQFALNMFDEFLKSYGLTHIRTGLYAPQSNASVNHLVIAKIRTYVDADQRNWDAMLSQISCAIRSDYHESVGTEPYKIVFETSMIKHGSSYDIGRKLGCLNNSEFKVNCPETQIEILHDKIRKNLKAAHEKPEKVYNLRAREINFNPGQEIYKRNFALSNKLKHFNAKLARKFIKCRIHKKIGSNLYDIENLKGKFICVYHGKDFKS